MPGRVAGKVVLVTGAASGIGRACAELLAREGARVALADVQEAAGREAADRIGGEAAFVRLDVSDEASWQAALRWLDERFGRLDALVNNAGIVLLATLEETSAEQFRRVQDVNALGVFLGCKHALPALRAAGGGSIVNVSSLAGLRGTPLYAAYSASKGAVRALTKSVAAHCLQRGDAIRCNSIHPGGVNTPMVHRVVLERTGVDLASPEQAGAAHAMGMAEPIEIAQLVLYLASDESRFVNGAELAIDGGASAVPGVIT